MEHYTNRSKLIADIKQTRAEYLAGHHSSTQIMLDTENMELQANNRVPGRWNNLLDPVITLPRHMTAADIANAADKAIALVEQADDLDDLRDMVEARRYNNVTINE